ncbi:hypothetical protein D3C76_1788540 [compost metagenome]
MIVAEDGINQSGQIGLVNQVHDSSVGGRIVRCNRYKVGEHGIGYFGSLNDLLGWSYRGELNIIQI